MPEVINALNFSTANLLETSELSADALASQAVVNALSAQGFAANNFLVVGTPGNERAELKQILSIATNAITLTANLATKHYQGEKIVKLYGDKIRIYRAANVDGTIPADASFALITTIDIEADQLHTQYTDSTGGSDYWYKLTYYNSSALTETSLSLSSAFRGGNYGHYVSIEEVKDEAGFKDAEYVSNSIVTSRRDQAESEVNGILKAAGYTLPLKDSKGSLFTPGVIENVTKLLAAGYLLSKEYAVTTPDGTKQADPRLKIARDILKQISKNELMLVDNLGEKLSQTGGVAGWPDDTTKDASESNAAEPVQFKMSMKF